MSKEQEFVGLLNNEMDGLIDDYAKRRIADLEAKLAESERSKEINIKERDKICFEMSVDYNKQIYQLTQALAETDKLMQEYLSKCLSLEQQLAEKEKEIEEAKDVLRLLIRTCGTSNCDGKKQTAIDELEKVKEFIIKNNEPTKKMTAITRFINQQINDLRSE